MNVGLDGVDVIAERLFHGLAGDVEIDPFDIFFLGVSRTGADGPGDGFLHMVESRGKAGGQGD